MGDILQFPKKKKTVVPKSREIEHIQQRMDRVRETIAKINAVMKELKGLSDGRNKKDDNIRLFGKRKTDGETD